MKDRRVTMTHDGQNNENNKFDERSMPSNIEQNTNNNNKLIKTSLQKQADL
jgi:hypothetical protein